MLKTLVLLLLIAALGQASNATTVADDPYAATVAAAAAFDAGDYTTAVDGYERAWQSGLANGSLAYNLGIAYYRLGRLGEAMAAFLAARTLLPRDPDVAANLAFIGSRIPDRLKPELPAGAGAAATAWISRFTPREYALMATILGLIIGLGLIGAQLWRPMSPATKPLLATLVLPIAILAAMTVQLAQGERWGAVVSPVAKVQSGPGSATTLFELRAGAPFVAEEERDAYVRILLSDGKRGWIADRDVKILR